MPDATEHNQCNCGTDARNVLSIQTGHDLANIYKSPSSSCSVAAGDAALRARGLDARERICLRRARDRGACGVDQREREALRARRAALNNEAASDALREASVQARIFASCNAGQPTHSTM